MLTNALPGVCGLLIAISIAACSRGLSREEAESVIEQNRLIRSTDKVSVDAISETGPNEAVVRATIAGTTANLKFRRFDTGWTWEFVETKSGGWIAPDVAMGEIREEHRAVAAAKWADDNKTGYATTAQTMEYIAIFHTENPKVLANPELVKLMERLDRNLAERLKHRPEKESQARYAVLTNDRWSDAWGNDIDLSFNAKDHSWLITSAGADKTKGTDDDLLCLNTFREGYEDGRAVWHHDKTWRVPEGLAGVVEPFFDKRTDKLEYSKVVKP